MKKIITIVSLLIAVSLNLSAQVDYSFGNIKNKRDKGVVPTIGIKGGLTHYYNVFSYDKYNKLADDFTLNPGFGLYIEYPVKKVRGLAISVEFMVVEKGFKKSFDYNWDLNNGTTTPEIDQLKANFIDLRVPIIYYMRHTALLSPYLFVAPDFGFCYGGEMTKTFTEHPEHNQSINISDTDAVKKYDISFIFGAGMRYNIHFQLFTMVLKLDASYNLGFLNTNGASEPTYGGIAYHVNDRRVNRGFELMFSIGIPLKFNRMHDSCWGW